MSLDIVPVSDAFWLGQRIAVTLRLRDATDSALLDAPVTCWTSWGRLAARHALGLDRGVSVSGRTGAAGLFKVRLEPPLAKPLSDAEQAVLEAELAGLDAVGVRTPAAAAKALQHMVSRYRAQGALLHDVVDRLFGGLGPPIDSNPHAAWPTFPVTLLAVAESPRGGAPGIRATTLRARDWRGPWFAALRQTLLTDQRIDKALVDALPTEGKAAAVDRLVGTARTFAGLQRGAVVAGIRDSIANIALSRVVDANAAELADAVADVAAGVGSAMGAISRGGLVVVDTIERARTETTAKLDLARFDQRLTMLEQTQVTAADLTALEDGLRSETKQAIEVAVSDLSLRLDAKLEQSVFDTQFGAIQEQLTGLGQTAVLRSELDALRDQLRGAAIEAAVAEVDRVVARLHEQFVSPDQLAEMNERTEKLSTRIEQLEGSAVTRDALDAELKEIRAATLDAVQRSMAEAVEGLRKEFATTEAFNAVSVRTDKIESRVGTLEERVLTRAVLEEVGSAIERRAVEAAVARTDELAQQLRRDFATSDDLESVRKQVSGKADTATLAALRGDVDALKAENRGVATRLDTLDNNVRDLRNTIRPPRGPGGSSGRGQ